MPALTRTQHTPNAALTPHSHRPPTPGKATPLPPSHDLDPQIEASLRLFCRGVIDFRRHTGHEAVALIRQRAPHLPAADRTLVEGVFRDGHSLRELARVLEPGASGTDLDTHARALARRLKRIVRRAMSPLFLFVAPRVERAREIGGGSAWPLERCRVATAVVLHGLSARQTADLIGITPYRVREHRRAVEAMFAGASV